MSIHVDNTDKLQESESLEFFKSIKALRDQSKNTEEYADIPILDSAVQGFATTSSDDPTTEEYMRRKRLRIGEFAPNRTKRRIELLKMSADVATEAAEQMQIAKVSAVKEMICAPTETAVTRAIRAKMDEDRKKRAEQRIELATKNKETLANQLRASQTLPPWTEVNQLQAYVAFVQGQIPHARISTWEAYDDHLMRNVVYRSPEWIKLHIMFVTGSWLAVCFGLDAEKQRYKTIEQNRAAMRSSMAGGVAEWARERGLALEDLTCAVMSTILGVNPATIKNGYSKTHPTLRCFLSTPDAIFDAPNADCLGEWKNMTGFHRIAVTWCGECPVGRFGEMKKPKYAGELPCRAGRKLSCDQQNGSEPVCPARDIRPCDQCIPCPRISYVIQTLGTMCTFGRLSDYLVYTIVSDDISKVKTGSNVQSDRDARTVYVAIYHVGFDGDESGRAIFWDRAEAEIVEFCKQVFSLPEKDREFDKARCSRHMPDVDEHFQHMPAAAKTFMKPKIYDAPRRKPTDEEPTTSRLPRGDQGYIGTEGLLPKIVEYKSPYLPACIVRLVAYIPAYVLNDRLTDIAKTCLAKARDVATK